jgi:AcrR family transcriptional regulator
MTEPRPLRADARRNRARVLAAAEEVFAAKGTSASTEEIAKAAGVGVGTLFRHFPTKEALLEAVLVELLKTFLEQATEATEAEHPGNAFFDFLRSWIAMAATKNAYVAALSAAGVVPPRLGRRGDRFRDALAMMIDRAQRLGAVRTDLTVDELVPVLVGTAAAAELAGHDRALCERTVEMMFDGLRPRPGG